MAISLIGRAPLPPYMSDVVVHHDVAAATRSADDECRPRTVSLSRVSPCQVYACFASCFLFHHHTWSILASLPALSRCLQPIEQNLRFRQMSLLHIPSLHQHSLLD